MFQNKMVTPAIPERVYTLCKIVEKGAISSVTAHKEHPAARRSRGVRHCMISLPRRSSAAARSGRCSWPC